MTPAQPLLDEEGRIKALREYAVLDTLPEQALDDLTALAAQICGTPIAMISLIDEHRQWFKSKVGTDLTETARDISFCGHAVHQHDLFVVPDATKDERFSDNPLVTGDPHICFYAGAPLVNPEDKALGALCVIDHVPRTLTSAQEQALRVLSRQAMTHIELRRHTRELVESENKFRQLAENITDVLWIASPDLNQIHYVSPAYERIWGRTQKELYEHPHEWFDSILLEDRKRVFEAFAPLLKDTPEVSVEYQVVRPDGTMRWVHDRGFQVRDAQGALVRLSGIASDITDRKQAEKASLRLAAIVEFSDDAIISKDLNGIITSWNQGAEKLFGYTASEMVGASIMRLIPADRQDEENLILGKIRHGESVEHFETIRRTKDGRLVHVSVTASPIKNAAGEPIGVSKVAHDITERKRAEEVLRDVSSRESGRLRGKVFLDLGVIFTLSALVFIIGHVYDVFDPVFNYFAYRNNQLNSDLDEAVATMVFFGLAMLVFSYRRLRESRREVLSQTQISRALSTLHSEMEAQVRQRTADLVRTNDDLRNEIAERQRAETIIKQFPAIIESSDDAIVSKTLDGIVTSWNPAAERMFGYAAPEIIGKPITVLFPPDRIREEAEIMARIARGDQVRHFETVRVRKDGQCLEVSATISPIKDASGKITGVSKIVRDITERNRAKTALVESEERLRIVTDNSRVGLVIVNQVRQYIYANTAYAEVLDLPSAALVGQRVPDVLAGVYEEQVRPQLDRAFAGERVAYELHKKVAGRECHYDVRYEPTKVNGEVTMVVVVITDITERIRTGEQLLWKTAFFEAQVNSALDGILVVDSQGKTILQNQRMIDLWNFPKDIANQNDDRLRLEWATNQVKDSQKFSEKVAYLYGHPDEISNEAIEFVDGRIFDRYSAPVRGEDGKYYGRIWSFRDITERKRAEEQIAEQAALLDKTQDAIIQRDINGEILFWSKGAERIYGWTREEAVGRGIADVLGFGPEWLKANNMAAQGKETWSGEFKHLTKDRREVMIEGRCTLIRDKEGQPKSVLVINTDITDKKKIEAQFMRAQRMESIGTLAGGVAHDLNNILAPIMMSIDILKSTSDSPQTTQILETIEVSAKRGADIVRQVLSFARGVEGNRIEVQPKHLLKDLENIIKDTFPKDIRLRFTLSNDTWTILGDPTQVHQILLNLCVNARDAMPNGGNLTISVENCVLDEQYAAMNIQAKPGRYVIISVTDSGMGIPQDILNKIFEPFFTTKDVNKGTGLGLSTVMAIVKSHEGMINVYSEPGKGTTFKVYLPAMETSSTGHKGQAEKINLPRGNGETILVVDDETSILTITGQTLQAFGYRVLTATDGADAVAVYARHMNEIAVVLTDMMMPVMDGPAMIHALTRINPAIKIVAASGLNANGDVAKVSGLGVKHFLTKPYTAGTLLKTMRTILEEPA